MRARPRATLFPYTTLFRSNPWAMDIAHSGWSEERPRTSSRPVDVLAGQNVHRSEEHTSELQSVAISYAVFCLKKKHMWRRVLPSFGPLDLSPVVGVAALYV